MPFIENLLTEKEYTLPIDGKKYPQLRFGDYFLLDKYRQSIRDSLSANNADSFIFYCKKIIELQYKSEINDPIKALLSILVILSENQLPQIAFLRPPPNQDTKQNPEGNTEELWRDKDGFLVSWIDLLCKNYHWTIEYILNQKIETILLLLQEIIAREFYDKEWNYRLTEFAYKYDAGSKKSTYQPLPKPFWLQPTVNTKIKKTKIHKDMLPKGNIIDTTGLGIYGQNISEEK